MKAELGEEGSMDLVRQWTLESMQMEDSSANFGEAAESIGEGQSLSDFLAERGYDC
jgi:hypothetical protein